MSRYSEMPQFAQEVRTALLETFPKQNISGMDPEKAEYFIMKQGLTVQSYVVLEENDLPKFKKIIGNTNLDRTGFDRKIRGFYGPEMQLAVCIKYPHTAKSDSGLYVWSSPLHQESILVHELAHGSAEITEYVSPTPTGVYVPRVGFVVNQYPGNRPSRGHFLEEGFAELLRGEYVSQYMTAHQLALFGGVLEIDQVNLNDTPAMETADNKLTPVPVKYVCLAEPQLLPSTPGEWCHAGFTLEMLIAKNPDLKQALIDSRRSVTGLRQVVRIINSFKPDLYMDFQRTDQTEVDFVRLKSRVIREVMGGYRNVVRGQGWVMDVWNGILKPSD